MEVFVYFTFPLYVVVAKTHAKFCFVFFDVQGLFCIIHNPEAWYMGTPNKIKTTQIPEV